MYKNYIIRDINGKGQIYDLYTVKGNTRRCRILKEKLLEVFEYCGVSLDNLKSGRTVQLSEPVLIRKSMMLY